MRKLVFMTLITFSFSVMAETELTCWNTYDKSGSAPILRAKITQEVSLESVTFNLKDEIFAGYFQNEVGNTGPDWGNKATYTKSFVQNPTEVLDAKIITTNRSPYKGNNEYAFIFGKYNFSSPYITQNIDYSARLILPVDLNAANLKTTRIRQGERVNAVMIYSPSIKMHQSGDSYLKMFCSSK